MAIIKPLFLVVENNLTQAVNYYLSHHGLFCPEVLHHTVSFMFRHIYWVTHCAVLSQLLTPSACVKLRYDFFTIMHNQNYNLFVND